MVGAFLVDGAQKLGVAHPKYGTRLSVCNTTTAAAKLAVI